MIKRIFNCQSLLVKASANSSLHMNKLYRFSAEQQKNEEESKENKKQEESEEQQRKKQQQEEARERAAKEAAIRKQMKEQQDITELKDQYEKSHSSFSTFSQFLKLIKSKVLLGGAGLFSLFMGYQLYDITESHVDPVDGSKKILPIKKRYEYKLADSISGIFQGENKIINTNKKLYNKMIRVQQKFKLFKDLEFPVNGKVYIIDRENFVFFMLPNGDLFVSRRAVFDLKEEELQILMGYELSHLYMRSSTKNIPFSELTNIFIMKMFDFTELFGQFVPMQEIRQYYTLALTQEQENNNMIMAADILDETGIELDPESLKYYLRDICSTFSKDPNPYLLDFFRKHPFIK